jgi:endonuclease/exonuclease/phosphatase family metal-dependent hydrolase
MLAEVCTRGRASIILGALAASLGTATATRAQGISPIAIASFNVPSIAAAVAADSTTTNSDIALHAKDASRVEGDWRLVADTTAAGGARLWNPDAGIAKLPAALSAPRNFFELTFTADANRGYRLWMRGRADRNAWTNDSVYVQFSGSVAATGTPIHRIGTTSATWVGIEDCSGCGLKGWGWQDNGYGAGVLGPLVYFAQPGPQTIRIQQREDGISIDQIVLSPLNHLTLAPGSTKDDQTLVASTAPAPVPDPAAASPVPLPAPGPVLLRVLQWNLHHGVGTDGRYDTDRIATWMAAMKPDVVLLNEVEKYTGWGNEDQPERYRTMLSAKTGRRWYSHFAQEYGNWSSNGKGSQILSTYPLDSTDLTELSYDRVIAAATITVNGRVITLMETHLDPDSQPYRLTQARQAITWASARPENRIIGGDFNAWPDQTSVAEMVKTYVDSWAQAATAGKALTFAGNSPVGATKKGRIDYIFHSRGASNLAVVQSQVYDTRDAAGVMPSDHRPVLTTFEVR